MNHCFFSSNFLLNQSIIQLFNRLFNMVTYFKTTSLTLIFLFFIGSTPSVFGQKNAKTAVKKDIKAERKAPLPFTGSWSGKGTVDYGFGSRTEFEYELILEQKKDGTITGVSVTFLHIGGKRYCAKALVEGKWNKMYLNCAEKYNITEDKLPDSSWIPFTQMELILKSDGINSTLEGIYKCSDGSNGRLLLKRKPPQV